jgi:hypothetical protein
MRDLCLRRLSEASALVQDLITFLSENKLNQSERSAAQLLLKSAQNELGTLNAALEDIDSGRDPIAEAMQMILSPF